MQKEIVLQEFILAYKYEIMQWNITNGCIKILGVYIFYVLSRRFQ
jgi:hypothetical protein